MTCVERIETLLREKGVTRNKFSQDIGISSATFYNWQTRGSTPKADILQRIAEYFGVSTDYLLGKTDNPQQYNFPRQEVTQQEAERYIERHGIQPTSLIPVIGVIQAGLPIRAEQNIEGWEMTTVKNTSEYFYLRVTGDSMINAGITDGCKVLIHEQPCADNGDIVACMVDGENATLKRFRQRGRTIMLIPENPDYEPIVLDVSDFESGGARIIGVAKQVVRDL